MVLQTADASRLDAGGIGQSLRIPRQATPVRLTGILMFPPTNLGRLAGIGRWQPLTRPPGWRLPLKAGAIIWNTTIAHDPSEKIQRAWPGFTGHRIKFAALNAGLSCKRRRVFWQQTRQSAPGGVALAGAAPARRVHSSRQDARRTIARWLRLRIQYGTEASGRRYQTALRSTPVRCHIKPLLRRHYWWMWYRVCSR
jgi:hypothetical protein